MMFWYGWHMPFWQAGLMWAGTIVFWGLLIWFAYALITNVIRRPGRDDRDAKYHGTAGQILDQRLASGEIDADEYRRVKDLISGAPRGTEHAEMTRS